MTRKILIDARKLGDGGIGVYIENIIDSLLALQRRGEADIKLTLLVRPEQSPKKKVTASITERWVSEVSFIEDHSPRYSFREYFALALRHRKIIRKHDLFHSPHYTLPFFLKIPAIVTVHDVLHISHPETFYHRPVAKQLIRSAMARAARVLTVSEASKRAIEDVLPGGLAPVAVVSNALRAGIHRVGDERIQDTLKKLQLEQPYAVFVGSDRPHKGFHVLIDAWLRLREELGERGIVLPLLVAVGVRYSEATKKFIRSVGLGPWVRFVGDITTADLTALYSGASAVVVPSKDEGFGLVALEAMACGAPVVAAPVESLHEVCENGALFSTECAAPALSSALTKLLSNSQLATDLATVGLARSKEFSLERFGREIYRQYCLTLGGAAPSNQCPSYEEGNPSEFEMRAVHQ